MGEGAPGNVQGKGEEGEERREEGKGEETWGEMGKEGKGKGYPSNENSGYGLEPMPR